MLAGFLTAPLPALILPEDYAIDRELVLLPFGVLIAILGLQRMWEASLPVLPRWLYWVPGVAALALGVLYAGVTMASKGRITGSTLLLIALGLAGLAGARILERTRRWWPLAVALLLIAGLQFVEFRSDYFAGYRARASGWFGGNIRGGIESVLGFYDEAGSAPVYLSEDIPYVRSYWRFYTEVYNRQRLSAAPVLFCSRTLDELSIPPGSLLLANFNDVEMGARAARGEFQVLSRIVDPDDSAGPQNSDDRTQFVVYQKSSSDRR